MTENVKSAVRVLDLLEILSTAERPLMLVEIAALLDAPKSSVLMLLRTLVARAYVERDPFDRYGINPALKQNDLGWLGGMKAVLVRQALPVMRELTARIGETSSLGTLAEDQRVWVIAKVVSPRPIRFDSDMTNLHTAHRTASGKAQLAFFGEEELDAYVARWNAAGDGPLRPADVKALKAELAGVRESGVALLIDEWVAGATGISSPIFDRRGAVIAALTLGAVTARFREERDTLIAATKAAAAEITRLHVGAANDATPAARKAQRRRSAGGET